MAWRAVAVSIRNSPTWVISLASATSGVLTRRASSHAIDTAMITETSEIKSDDSTRPRSPAVKSASGAIASTRHAAVASIRIGRVRAR